jgi:hypothetical protein
MTNPLLANMQSNFGSMGIEALQDYADHLNRMNFSTLLGYHWCISERTLEDGTLERFLDRKSTDILRFNSLPKAQRYSIAARA